MTVSLEQVATGRIFEGITGDRLGQVLATRAARELQLGLELYW